MAQPVLVNIQTLNKEITVPTGLFINNEFVPSSDSTEVIECVLGSINSTSDKQSHKSPAL
jgi:hypothetical protein